MPKDILLFILPNPAPITLFIFIFSSLKYISF